MALSAVIQFLTKLISFYVCWPALTLYICIFQIGSGRTKEKSSEFSGYTTKFDRSTMTENIGLHVVMICGDVFENCLSFKNLYVASNHDGPNV